MALVVAVSSFCVDFVWAHYTLAVTGRRALWSAALAAAIIALAAITVRAYVASPWYVLPAALGSAAGTYAAVRRSK